MVFVKVRETYDLHTIDGKITVIGVHTPTADIIKRNYPGLLMQCKAYRPVSCDVKMACASMLPVDPLGVGTETGEVSPEDIFNPILYKAMGNFGMSQLELYLHSTNNFTSKGASLDADTDGLTSDDFNLYYGLLANTHDWKHANPQQGMSMFSLRPLVYERLETVGEVGVNSSGDPASFLTALDPANPGVPITIGGLPTFRGNAKPMPWLNTTTPQPNSDTTAVLGANSGFPNSQGVPNNSQVGVPAPKIYCGIIIVPPSRLHKLYYRLVCEWTLEFTQIRPLSDIVSFSGLQSIGSAQHIQDYSYSTSKTLLDTTDLVDTSDDSGIKKVM